MSYDTKLGAKSPLDAQNPPKNSITRLRDFAFKGCVECLAFS